MKFEEIEQRVSRYHDLYQQAGNLVGAIPAPDDADETGTPYMMLSAVDNAMTGVLDLLAGLVEYYDEMLPEDSEDS